MGLNRKRIFLFKTRLIEKGFCKSFEGVLEALFFVMPNQYMDGPLGLQIGPESFQQER